MTKRNREFQILWNEARIAGLLAGAASVPIPMVISGYPVVEGGVCGFAWIKIRPANSPFANWLKKNGLGKTSSYAGGVTIFVHDFGQSLTRKEAYAAAFAGVLAKAGINAYGDSRID